MNTTKKAQARELKPHFPSLETIQQELGTAQSIDDFFGKAGYSRPAVCEDIGDDARG